MEQMASVVERESADLLRPREATDARFLFKQVAVCVTHLLKMPECAESCQAPAQDDSGALVAHSNLSNYIPHEAQLRFIPVALVNAFLWTKGIAANRFPL